MAPRSLQTQSIGSFATALAEHILVDPHHLSSDNSILNSLGELKERTYTALIQECGAQLMKNAHSSNINLEQIITRTMDSDFKSDFYDDKVKALIAIDKVKAHTAINKVKALIAIDQVKALIALEAIRPMKTYFDVNHAICEHRYKSHLQPNLAIFMINQVMKAPLDMIWKRNILNNSTLFHKDKSVQLHALDRYPLHKLWQEELSSVLIRVLTLS